MPRYGRPLFGPGSEGPMYTMIKDGCEWDPRDHEQYKVVPGSEERGRPMYMKHETVGGEN